MTATNILARKAIMAALLASVSITTSHLAKIVHLRPAAKPKYANASASGCRGTHIQMPDSTRIVHQSYKQ
jgi:hypothetical protein